MQQRQGTEPLLDLSIVIADEPTNNFDAASSAGVADALFSRAANGGILLFATHDTGVRTARLSHHASKR